MDCVKTFNSELCSLYDQKLPISRTKMAEVTEAAIKSAKFYKHVVQSVEKFIQKCQPEYKLPGLYVIDAIVRESRRQFSPEKDLFAPRFSKNFEATFQNLLTYCPPSDKCKIVRVLNLWQKHGVYSASVVQPLLDMAGDILDDSFGSPAASAKESVSSAALPATPSTPVTSHSPVQTSDPETVAMVTKPDMDVQDATGDLHGNLLRTITQLMQQQQQQPLQNQTLLPTLSLLQLQLLQQQLAQQMPNTSSGTQGSSGHVPQIDSTLLAQIQAITATLLTRSSATAVTNATSPVIDKKNDAVDAMQQPAPVSPSRRNVEHQSDVQSSPAEVQVMKSKQKQPSVGDEGMLSAETVRRRPGEPTSKLAADSTLSPKKTTGGSDRCGSGTLADDIVKQAGNYDETVAVSSDRCEMVPKVQYGSESDCIMDTPDYEQHCLHQGHVVRQHPDSSRSDQDQPNTVRRSRSRSSSRTPGEMQSYTQTWSDSSRRRSSSRERRRCSRSRSSDEFIVQRSVGRRSKYDLPPSRDHHVSICSHVLWIGNVRHTSEIDLKARLASFGQASVSLEPFRGCAFATFERRSEAARALEHLDKSHLNGRIITVRWAPGVGIKNSEFIDRWDVDVGAAFIPWEKLPSDLDTVTEGSIVDEDSLPVDFRRELPVSNGITVETDTNVPVVTPVSMSCNTASTVQNTLLVTSKSSMSAMCSSTRDEPPRAAWQQTTAPTLPVSGVASLLTYPPHIGPVPPPPGVPPPVVGVPPPAGVVLPLVGGVLPAADVPVRPPAGVPPPAGSVPASATVSLPLNVPASLSLSGTLPVGGPQLSGVPQPVGFPMPVGVPIPAGGPSLVGISAAVNCRLPAPRFMAGFDPTVPPPAFRPALSSGVVTSVTEMPSIPASRAAEDMDLDNSNSSDEDLGEGFDEEWPICSRRVSSRSHSSSHQPTFIRDQGLQLSECPTSGSSFHSSELKQPDRCDNYLRMDVEQPHVSRMYNTPLQASGNNFAISSAPLDHINPVPLPSSSVSMLAVGGPGLVRSLTSLPQPASLPARMTRAPGSVNLDSGSALRGPCDVDLRTSSYGGGMVPVGPPPLSAPMQMVPPPLPPLARLPRTLPACYGIDASGFNSAVAGLETARDMLGPRLAGVAFPGPVGMSDNPPPALSAVRNIPGSVPPVNCTASVHGMVTSMVRGPTDMSIGPRFINPVPSSAVEPANVRPASQQVFMQGNINMNPGMMSAAAGIGPVSGQIPGGGQVVDSGPIESRNIALPSNFVAGGTLPVNAGNGRSLRGPAEFSTVIRNVVPPDTGGFNIQHEMPRIRALHPSSVPPGVNNTSQYSAGPVPQIPPFSHGQLPVQFPGAPLEQKASLSGPSDRLLNALHNLAGMQTGPSQDHPSHASGGSRSSGITETRFADSPVQKVDAGLGQMVPGVNRILCGPQVDASGFGPLAVRSLLQQNRTDGISQSLPAPTRLGAGQLRLSVDNSRDHSQHIDMSTNIPLSERRALAGDGMLDSTAQFPSSLPAPPRVSNLLPPPPRVGTQSTAIDTRGRDSIDTLLHNRAMPGSRLMPDNTILPGLVMGSNWLSPRQTQRGLHDRSSLGHYTRSLHRGYSRRVSSEKWRYKRWHAPNDDRSYLSRRHQHVSGESTRYGDEVEEDTLWQTNAGNVNQLRDSYISPPPAAELSSESVSLANDKECNDVPSSSTDSHQETVPPS